LAGFRTGVVQVYRVFKGIIFPFPSSGKKLNVPPLQMVISLVFIDGTGFTVII